MLNQYGIKIINNNYQSFIVIGNQEYHAQDYQVEADFPKQLFILLLEQLEMM